MAIQFHCTQCNKLLRTGEDLAGKQVKCPECGTYLKVPAAGPVPTQTTEPLNKPIWYLKTGDGQEFGPITRSQLDRWHVEGKVDAECQILRDGWPSWKWAEDVYPALSTPQRDVPIMEQESGPPRINTDSPVRNQQSYEGGGYTRHSVPNYLVQAILCTLFCCLPFGVVAIVFAAQVNGKLAAGDYRGARVTSDSARTWCWVSFGLGVVPIVLWFLIFLASVNR